MRRTLAYGAATTQGHANVQADGFYVDPGKHFYLLANGLGGHPGERRAKALLLEMAEWLRTLEEMPTSSGEDLLSKEETFLRQCFLRLHKKASEENSQREWPEKAASSMLVAWKSAGGLFTLANCGSSGAMVFRGGKFHPVLLPQIQPVWGISMPAQAIGLGVNIFPEFRSITLGPQELLLLYTDGFANAVGNVGDFCATFLTEHIREHGEALTPTAQAIVEAAIGQGITIDNASIVLVEGA